MVVWSVLIRETGHSCIIISSNHGLTNFDVAEIFVSLNVGCTNVVC